MFIEEGSCDIYINNICYHLTSGDVIYCPLGCTRSGNNPQPGTKVYAFDFQLSGIDILPLTTVTHFDNLDIFNYEFSRFNYAWFQKHDGYKLYCMGLFVIILYKLEYVNLSMTDNPYIKTIKRYIVDHFDEPLNIEHLAKLVNINTVYCGSLFKKYDGRTIHEYINQIRINKAKAMLNSDSMTISEIAYQTGYNDIFYFSKTFKKITGLSPSQYKKQLNN